MNIKKDHIVIFSVILTTLASAGDLYFNFTQHLTNELSSIEILIRVFILIFFSFSFLLIYKLFFQNANNNFKQLIKYLIAIPLCFALIFLAGIFHNPHNIESEIKFKSKRNAPIHIARSANEAMEELSPKQIQLLIEYKKLENESKKLENESKKLENRVKK